MDTRKVKSYAPKARRDFLDAVKRRLGKYGITESSIESVNYKGDIALIGNFAISSQEAKLREKLVSQIRAKSFAQILENAAYTWFNRFVAIRYMELKGFLEHGRRVLSHPEKEFGFEILDDALNIDLPDLNQKEIRELKLAGTKDEEIYRLLIIAQCKALHKAMPFLFERLDDVMELLLPDNLTATDSVIRSLVTEIPESDWENVEIVGWLYQFYISEKKDEVIGKVVKSEDIPAATQLFTPNWIVKYLVQNSVGRIWVNSNPLTDLKANMKYYIETDEHENTSNIDIEDIKVLDPACGSGHILVEVYEILKAVYLEKGYRDRDIPQIILEKNIFGLDIDDRAAQLAGFALMMKARQDDRRIFRKNIKLNIFPIRDSKGIDKDFIADNLANDFINRDFILGLTDIFYDAKTFGSLVSIPEEYDIVRLMTFKDMLDEMNEEILAHPVEFLNQKEAIDEILPLLNQAILLAQKYDAVVANPPYMGGKAMNTDLRNFAKKNFPDTKSDLFAMFMERCFSLLKAGGFEAMITMQSWMFLSSYEKMRKKILKSYTIKTMAHLDNMVMGIAFGTSAFILQKTEPNKNAKAIYFKIGLQDLDESREIKGLW